MKALMSVRRLASGNLSPRRRGQVGRTGRRGAASLAIVTLLAIAPHVARAAEETLTIDYRRIVDRTPITHQGRSVGRTMDRLAEGPDEEEAKALEAFVEPYLEPYAFLLEDALVDSDAKLARPGLYEVACLFPPGEPQPAWADLLRTRRYVVLTDGRGYVRAFLPGDDARSAFEKHAPVLNRVLSWLLRCEPKPAGLDVDVYAYRNDLRRQRFTLNTSARRRRFDAPPARPQGMKPLPLKGIEDFLKQGLTLEGAYLDEAEGLILLGSRPKRAPTIDGHPVTLADLAVAYRAVFYGGKLGPFISLDRAEYPDGVNVNFGGRLADTRIDWVLLRCDMRLKTIGNGLDSDGGLDRSDEIRREIADFLSQKERIMRSPDRPRFEETRFWFYPRETAAETDGDDRYLRIINPRFVAAAERQRAVGARGDLPVDTPPWTKDCIDHVNDQYERYAGLFPELYDLDTTGRLLALFAWLKGRAAGTPPIDLDALLDVQLPRVTTPRSKSQLLIGGVRVAEVDSVRLVLTDCSEVAERAAARRSFGARGGRNGAAPDRTDIDQELLYPAALTAMKDQVIELAVKRLGKDLVAAGMGPEEVLKNSFGVVTGGIGADLTESIARGKLPDAAIEEVGPVIRSDPLTPKAVPDSKLEWSRSGVEAGPGLAPEARRIGRGEPRGISANGEHITVREDRDPGLVSTGGGGAGDGEPPRFGHTAPMDPGSDRPSWGFRLKPDGSGEYYRAESGRRYSYHFETVGSVRSARPTRGTATPFDRDLALVVEALSGRQRPEQAWARLDEQTTIVAIEQTEDGGVAVLHGTELDRRLTIVARDGSRRVVEGRKAAQDAFHQIAWERAGRVNDPASAFVQAVADPTGAGVVIRGTGGREVKLTSAEMRKLIDDPAAAAPDGLDEVMAGYREQGRQLIVLRDQLDSRPARFGGSLREGTETDPVRFAALLNERYGANRVVLDDHAEVARRNLAAMTPIARPEDVEVVVPEETLGVNDWGLVERIREKFQAANIRVVPYGAEPLRAPNLLVVTGHNDGNLAAFLEEMGAKGELRGKTVLLNTCYTPGQADALHRIIMDHGALGIVLHPETIYRTVVERVMVEMPGLIREAERTGRSIHPADLLKRAAEKALSSPGVKPKTWMYNEILKLKRAPLQVSDVGGRTLAVIANRA